MALNHSSKVITDGLVFYYDAENTSKSWKGKPTTNHAYGQNARIDNTYAPYVYTTSGTWQIRHPDALRVYNFQGSEITGYVNTGVTDHTNTYHAIWTLDPELKRPVVTMRDIDGAWKAKSFGLSSGTTPTAMGLNYGDLYTISWLQWTDDISKSVNAGLYGPNLSATNAFHDGLSQSAYNSSRAWNTKPYTWQRVWATFQVSAVRDLSAGWSCYMYGHYNTRGTVKIADVQIETGYVSGFIENGGSSRSNDDSIKDLTKNKIINSNSLTYNFDGSFSFNGTSNYITIPQPTVSTSPNRWTISGWIKPNVNHDSFFLTPQSAGVDHFLALTVNAAFRVSITESSDVNNRTYYSPNGSIPAGVWSHFSVSIDNLTLKLFINGVQYINQTETISIAGWAGNWILGQRGNSTYWFNGSVSSLSVYDRALSDTEVKQNFNALRGRYGI